MNFQEVITIFKSGQHERFKIAADALLSTIQNDLSVEQISALTRAIAFSGHQFRLPAGNYADVASTGGPASLTTLLCPVLLASIGVGVPKISASGSIAGAIDTMETIPGFRSSLSESEFYQVLGACRFAHMRQTAEFCPADQVLFSLRRERQKINVPSLIVSSLLSKKLVVIGTAAVFDFRVGVGGNVGSSEQARTLARLFFDVSKLLDIRVGIVLTNGDYPCSAFGRKQSLALLRDFLFCVPPETALDTMHLETCIEIAAHAASLTNTRRDIDSERDKLKSALANGTALACFKQHIEAQGGNWAGFESSVEVEGILRSTLFADRAGYWHPPNIDVVKKWIKSESGRVVDGQVRNRIGLKLLQNPGSKVYAGDPLMEVSHIGGIDQETKERLVGQITTEQPETASPIEFVSGL